jgi:hypothetical protein
LSLACCSFAAAAKTGVEPFGVAGKEEVHPPIQPFVRLHGH